MKVEILRPPTTSFVVGRDLVGYAKVGNDPDVWEDLIPNAGAFSPQRGGTTTPKVNALDVGTLSVPLKDMDPETDTRLRVGRRLRLVDEERGGRVLWFGRLSDIPASDEQTHMVTTLAATDAVDELGNATVKGVGVPGEVESLRARVAKLGAFSTVPLVYVTPRSKIKAGEWENVPLSGRTVAVGDGWTVSAPANALDFAWPSATFSTQPGFTYRVTLTYKGSTGAASPDDVYADAYLSDGSGVGGDPSRLTLDNTTRTVTLQITAPSESALLSFGVNFRPYSIALQLTEATVERFEGPAVLQAVGREASITEHLDMACDSVGAVWRPTLTGTVEVIEGDLIGNSLGRLTDDPDDVDALASYTKLDLGFAATDDLINELTVTNHGPSAETTRVYTNAASIAAHGRRSASIDLCLATSDLLDERAAQLLAEASTPRWSPRSLTYVYEALPFVPDLYDLIDVRRRGVTHRCLVLGVSHELEPDPTRPNGVKHLVTLTLRKVA